MLPVHDTCRGCASNRLEKSAAEGGGTLLSYTTVYADPTGKKLARPRLLGVVRLDEGPTLMAFLLKTGKRTPVIGDRVAFARATGKPPRHAFLVLSSAGG